MFDILLFLLCLSYLGSMCSTWQTCLLSSQMNLIGQSASDSWWNHYQSNMLLLLTFSREGKGFQLCFNNFTMRFFSSHDKDLLIQGTASRQLDSKPYLPGIQSSTMQSHTSEVHNSKRRTEQLKAVQWSLSPTLQVLVQSVKMWSVWLHYAVYDSMHHRAPIATHMALDHWG